MTLDMDHQRMYNIAPNNSMHILTSYFQCDRHVLIIHTSSGVIAAVDWVANRHQPGKKSVAM